MTSKKHQKWALWYLFLSAIFIILFDNFSNGFVTFYQATNPHDYTYLPLLSGSNSDDSILFPLFSWVYLALTLIGLIYPKPSTIPILFITINTLLLALYPFYDGEKLPTLIFNTIWHEHNIFLIAWLGLFILYEVYSLQVIKQKWWG